MDISLLSLPLSLISKGHSSFPFETRGLRAYFPFETLTVAANTASIHNAFGI